MKRSNRLPVDDIRNVFRVLGHARDLRYDQIQQDRVVVDAMTKLLGAHSGHATRIGEFRPEAPTYIQRFTPGTIQDLSVVKYFRDWDANSSFEDDPLKHITWDKAGPVYTLSRSSVMSYKDMRQYRIYDEMVEPAGLYDVIITFFRYPRSNNIRQYVFQRKVGQEKYGLRDLRMANLFTTEMHRLYHEGVLEPSNPLDKLPERLSQVARQLRTGMNQREIALTLNLSYHTVRSYTKELYDIVGVSSREELVAKLFIHDGLNKSIQNGNQN